MSQLDTSLASPMNNQWNRNKAARGNNQSNKIEVKMGASSRMLYKYSLGTSGSGAFWLDETPQEAIHMIPGGEMTVVIYANKYINRFDNFNGFTWTGLNCIDIPQLQELDLSGLSSVPSSDFFTGGVYYDTTDGGVGLKSIRKLNLSNVTLTGDNASSYTLNLKNCSKLQELDISNSSITNVTYPTEAVLKVLNLSGTKITSLNMADQSFLSSLDISNCDKLTSVKITNCESLTSVNIPSSVTTVEISNCKGLTTLSIPYTGNSSIASNLININIDNCPSLKTFDIRGQNNPNLEVSLVGAWNIEDLDLSNTQIASITFPSKDLWTSLKSLKMYQTNFSYFNYNNSENVDYLDLAHFPDLQSITAYSCSNLTKVVLANNIDNPIELGNNAFMNCSKLERVYGHVSIEGTHVFSKCSSFKLNDDWFYQEYTVEADFVDHDEVLNIQFNKDIISNCFEGCGNLTSFDFQYIIGKLNDKITDTKSLFSGCSGVAVYISTSLLRNVPNLKYADSMFEGTGIYGAITSYDDESNPGFLDYIPECLSMDSMFKGTGIQYIDNNLFAYRNGQPLKVTSINNMFANCANLCAVDNSWDPTTPTPLDSKTFFINLDNLTDKYPKGVFSGAGKYIDGESTNGVQMKINTDENGNTYLFHRKEKTAGYLGLTSDLYDGVDLIGEIGPNVFGGISEQAGEYYIPKFQSIESPFGSNPENLEVDLDKCVNMFQGISTILYKATGVLSGVKLIGNKKIPVGLFKNCSKLSDLSNFFSGLEFGYDNSEEFEFPVRGMFDDCTSLDTISGLIQNCNKNKIKLIGGQFKNCKLKNVDNAFNYSGIYGYIPYKLFYMEGSNGSVRQTIESMSGVFSACYYLGYDKTREYLDYTDINGYYTDVRSSHIVKEGCEGNRLNFKIEDSEIDANDSWCIDGYYRSNSLIEAYTQYDKQQAECIKGQSETGHYKPDQEVYQNYLVPADIFRYCAKNCKISDVLSSLSWNKKVIGEISSGTMGVMDYVDENKNYVKEGCVGRIPMRIFESLTTTTSLSGMFDGVNYEPFVGLISKEDGTYTRGMMYPPDLFIHNASLKDVSSCFANTTIPAGYVF
jgi:hypothetical protein